MDDISGLIAEARRQGWGVERRKSGHYMLTPPARGSPLIVVSGTAGDHRAYAKIRCQLKRAGLLLPADHTPKEMTYMAKRTTTTPTRPTATTAAPAKASRSERASAASAKAAVTRVPRNSVVDALPTPLSRADEARFAAEQRALAKGDTLQAETKLDRDLAHLGDPDVGRRTVSSRRRLPQEQALVYRGSRLPGPLVAHSITVTVPDEDNESRVADLQATIPGMSEDEQRAAHAAACALRGVDTPYQPLADRLIVSGIDYQMGIGKGVLVHEDDVDWLLNHPVHLITRADGDDDEERESVSPAIAKRNAVAAASQRKG
jgi:hypothetical protein